MMLHDNCNQNCQNCPWVYTEKTEAWTCLRCGLERSVSQSSGFSALVLPFILILTIVILINSESKQGRNNNPDLNQQPQSQLLITKPHENV